MWRMNENLGPIRGRTSAGIVELWGYCGFTKPYTVAVFLPWRGWTWQIEVISMPPRMNEKEFRKKSTCPPSDELLAFTLSELRDYASESVAQHTDICDFCKMEVELYRRHPQSQEGCETPLIPRALYEFAKSMLSRGESDTAVLNRMFGDDGELELNQACGAF